MFTLFFVDDLPTSGSYEFSNEDANHAIRGEPRYAGSQALRRSGGRRQRPLRALPCAYGGANWPSPPLETRSASDETNNF